VGGHEYWPEVPGGGEPGQEETDELWDRVGKRIIGGNESQSIRQGKRNVFSLVRRDEEAVADESALRGKSLFKTLWEHRHEGILGRIGGGWAQIS